MSSVLCVTQSRKSTRLEEMSDVKQTGGKGESEEDKQSPAQEKRTCTTKNLRGMNDEGIHGTKGSLMSFKMVPKINTWYTSTVTSLFPHCVHFSVETRRVEF
jgi:hypothetical protein